MEQIKWKIKAGIEVNLTGEDVDDIMCSALEGGICYWCYKAEVVGEYRAEWAHEQISRGGSLILYHEDGWNDLNIGKLLKGIKRVIADGRLKVTGGRIDGYDIDGEVADMIVQYAIFDEVIFG